MNGRILGGKSHVNKKCDIKNIYIMGYMIKDKFYAIQERCGKNPGFGRSHRWKI